MDEADFFFRVKSKTERDQRIAGSTSIEKSVGTVLERAFIKGRWRDGGYVEMSEEEREEYMKRVAGHEAIHLVGNLEDLRPERKMARWSHVERGYVDRKDCLGYSVFEDNALLCAGCIEGVQAFWYGIEKQRERRFLASESTQ